MDEETDDAPGDADVSVEEAAGDETNTTLKGINTLAITTPKSKKDDRVSPISIDIKTIITYKNAGGIGQVTPLNIAVHRIRFFNTNG